MNSWIPFPGTGVVSFVLWYHQRMFNKVQSDFFFVLVLILSHFLSLRHAISFSCSKIRILSACIFEGSTSHFCI